VAYGIADFVQDPELLGPWFSGPSWTNWLVTLKAAFCEPLTDDEAARFRELAEREPPRRRVREAWFAIGRRAGKDSIASAVATYIASLSDVERFLRPGERAVVACLAVDKTQAAIVFRYIAAYFERIPMLAELVVRITDDTIELDNGVEITVLSSNYRRLRGKTILLAIFDEIAFFFDDSGTYTNPDVEIYRALTPALVTLRKVGAMIIGISTVHRKAGLLYNKWRQHHGQDGDVLVIRAPSTTFNPSLDPDEIDEDIRDDPARGEAEWLSEWRTDLQDFVDRKVIEACTVPGRHELPYQHGINYFGFADPSGRQLHGGGGASRPIRGSGIGRAAGDEAAVQFGGGDGGVCGVFQVLPCVYDCSRPVCRQLAE
jgi:hypothetical protein